MWFALDSSVSWLITKRADAAGGTIYSQIGRRAGRQVCTRMDADAITAGSSTPKHVISIGDSPAEAQARFM